LKDQKAVIIIEEGAGGSYFKQALKLVWVQMIGLPEELRDYPTIWAIGTILGVTKEVDMKFTRVRDRPWFQVLDPELIPYSVDVVIGDFIYELHFKVEPDMMHDNVKLLIMDDMEDKGGEGEGKEDLHEENNMQIDQGEQGQRDGDSSGTPNQLKGKCEAQGSMLVLFQVQVPELAEPKHAVPVIEKEVESEDGDVEHPDGELMVNSVEMNMFRLRVRQQSQKPHSHLVGAKGGLTQLVKQTSNGMKR
jgi:hypothetical protein